MHSSYRVAGKMAGPGMARRMAWIAWSFCVSLIFAATVIWFLEGGNLLRYAHIILIGITFGLFGTVGALIVWQRPRNTVGWILCAIGIGTGITDFSGAYAAYGMVEGHLPLPGTEVFNWLGNTVWPVNWVLFLVFLPLLFPDGRLLTRRWRIVGWLAAVLALLSILAGWLSDGHVELFGQLIPAALSDTLNLLVLPLTTAALVSLVLRFIRAKERERQQIKWVILGIIATMIFFIALGILTTLDPDYTQVRSLGFLLAGVSYFLALLIIPLAISFSILRYHLWDIDLLINRTLVYTTLTAILALIYFGGVVLLQHLVNGVTGQVGQSPLVIVASTLTIAALFHPLRRRIQKIIDKRFYRRKYDTARVLADFSSTLRSEMDLSQLREQLVEVVQETMQPAHVSLWLRKPEQERKHSTK